MDDLIKALEKCEKEIEAYNQKMRNALEEIAIQITEQLEKVSEAITNPEFIKALEKVLVAINEAKEIENQNNHLDIEPSKNLLHKANFEVLISAKKDQK